MCFHQRPLGFLALNEGQCHCHLGICELGSELHAHSSKRKITLGSKRSQDWRFRPEVDSPFLRWKKRWVDKLCSIVLNDLLLLVLLLMKYLFHILCILFQPTSVFIGHLSLHSSSR